MKKNITPLGFLRIDGKLEGSFPMLMTEPNQYGLSSEMCYEEIVVWTPGDIKSVEVGRANFKTRVRLA